MQTSLELRNKSWAQLQDKLPKKRREIYTKIKLYEPVTAQYIAAQDRRQHNEVNPRFTELAEVGLIKQVGKSENDISGNLNTLWSTTTDDEQINIINKKFVELRDKKDAIIADYHKGLSPLSLKVLKQEAKKIDTKIKNLRKWN